ncbi:MAG: (2Fe-2S)-binding protein [Candidatus Dormibacteraeota bacterium]|nr:(2Fe-2S)-binding protein [Candidatus Dormibacteraeota bacterium]
MPDAPAQDVTLTIDGHSVTVPRGTLVVEAAKKLGIEVPVFCYHHKMEPVGACRMCVVEIAPGPPRAQTACTTPVAPNMNVQTNSAMAVSARADVLEMELVNHPLDCPVCDKGGECPLQDYTFRHAYPVSQTAAPRLHFQKPIPLSDRIALDRERCVLCYRCTRYYDEITWDQELTVNERGARTFIASQFDEPLQSPVSGNIIDLCPVGALTSRVWRFESRPWDMDHTRSVCTKCAVGCSVTLWQRRGELVRITSHENDAVDDGWICDRGRFEYTDVNHKDRLRVPTLNGLNTTWEEAMAAAAAGLRGKRIGISLRRETTNEELFLIKRLLAGPLRGARVTLEGRTQLPPPEGETLGIEDLDRAKTIVVIASDTLHELPVLNLRIKKASTKGFANLILVHPDELDLDRAHRDRVEHVRPGADGTAAAVRGLAGHRWLKEGAGPVAILYGDRQGEDDAAGIAAAVQELAKAAGAGVMPLYRGTNERAALALGLGGQPADLKGVQALLTVGPPVGDIPSSARFVVALDHLPRPEHERADVVLPIPSFAETQGSLTNLEGRVQWLHPILPVEPPVRETWDVIQELGVRLGSTAPEFIGIFPLQREAAASEPALATLAEPPAAEEPPRAVLQGPARP